MPVVVTGSSGFIGTHLVGVLLARGESVIGIDRVRPRPRPGLQPLVADLLDADDRIAAALADATAVFHLAGCPGVRDTAADVAARRWRDNVLATEAILAATPLGTPLVVTSSSSVYGGAASRGRGCREADRLRPRGGYARSKAAVEARCADRLARGGLVAVARPFTVAGEGQRADMALATWLTAATAGRPIRLLGSPARTRDVTDVRDVVRALVAMADRGVIGTMNIGTGVPHRLDELVAAVLTVTGAPAGLVLAPAADEEVRHTRADTQLIRRRLGFVPRTSLVALVARQAAAAGIELAPALAGASR